MRATTDLSLFYEKPPSEMSRYELQELERLIRLEDEGLVEEESLPEGIPEFDENGEPVSKEFIAKQTDEFKDLQRQIRQI